MELTNLIAGLAFDPNIRGILIVVGASTVLMGSVYLILYTNVGARLGLLVAASGFFGWMTVMGAVWWMYGIGLKGNTPTWIVKEVNVEDLSGAETEIARSLPGLDSLPAPSELLAANPDMFPLGEFGETSSLSDLAVAPGACELFQEVDLGGWRLEPVSALGEPQAVADPILTEEGYFSSSSGYKVLNGFTIGGKDDLRECPDDEVTTVDRVVHFFTTLSPTHPPHYFVLQIQPVITQKARTGEAPPRPVVDPTKPIMNIVMVRDLGDLRFPPAMITMGSLLIFLVLVSMMNRRDRILEQYLHGEG